MPEKRSPKRRAGKAASKKPARAKPRVAKRSAAGGSRSAGKGSFVDALTKLLVERKVPVPPGLRDAPPEAYARQPAGFVRELAKLDDDALRARAERIAGHAERQAERARAVWDTSPLVQELRRRKLTEPPRPTRVVGAAVSIKRPLREWSDREILAAAKEWSERGRP